MTRQHEMTDQPLQLPALDVIAPLVQEMGVQDLRWLLSEVLDELQTQVSGVGMLLIVDALRQCADDGGDPIEPERYEVWRQAQSRPEDWPSAELIARSCAGYWAPALSLADIPVPSGVRGHQRKNQDGFSREEAAAALLWWAEDATPDSTVFEGYREWAVEQMRSDPALVLPVNPHTFIKLFDDWEHAVDEVIPEVRVAEREREAREEAARDEEVLGDLRRAAADLDCDVKSLSRPRYDGWAKETRRLGADRRPASSHTIQRRFSTWAHALDACERRSGPSPAP